MSPVIHAGPDPKRPPLTYSKPDALVDFLKSMRWVHTIFSESGLPDTPYFGPHAVQVIVLRDPIRR